MTTQEFWADVRKEQTKLYADQAERQAIVDRGGSDPCPWQPLSEPFAWSVTLPVRGGVQKGGAIVPLSFEILARNIVGPNGHALNRLATEAEMTEFQADEASRRAAIQKEAIREQRRAARERA